MIRYLAGVASALLLVAAGFFIWRSQAERESAVPPAPEGRPIASLLSQPPPATPPAAEKSREEKRFARYDKDEDGRITRAEIMASRRPAFDKLDKDGNGALSFEEWAVKTSAKFAEADADRNGALTPAEFATTAPRPKPRPRCTC